MRIRDLLAAESIELNGSAAGKQDVLNKMVDLMAKSGKIRDVETYRKGVFAREEEGTTGIGEGIAIPHCKSDAVKAPGLAAMVVKDGVEFDALDGAPVNLLFLIAAPNTEDNVHLEVLSKLSVLLMDENFTNGLKNAKTVDEFLKVIDDAESAKDEDEKEDETGAKYKVLAVTGCPTGIAHTYMAAESLEKHAAEMGITIKVETRGSGGAKHVLTDEEIAGATAIIVAADTKVPMDRFDGKKVIGCKVADGINKAEQLLNRAVAGDGTCLPCGRGQQKRRKSRGWFYRTHDLHTPDEWGIPHASVRYRRRHHDSDCISDRYPDGLWCNRWIGIRFLYAVIGILQVCRRTGNGTDGSGACRLHCILDRRPAGTCSWFYGRFVSLEW